MGDFKSKLKRAVLRRTSTTSSFFSSAPSTPKQQTAHARHASSTSKLPHSPTSPQLPSRSGPESVVEQEQKVRDSYDDQPPSPNTAVKDRHHLDRPESLNSGNEQTLQNSIATLPTPSIEAPKLTLEAPSPDQKYLPPLQAKRETILVDSPSEDQHTPLPTAFKVSASQLKTTEPSLLRKQSLVDSSNAHIIQALLQGDSHGAGKTEEQQEGDYFHQASSTLHPGMLHRKIWVKRPGASATLVQVREDDLVDDVRDQILRKYGNSLGRNFDAPDVTLRIILRADQGHKHAERTLGPEEEMCRALDQVYPGGQTVEEALIIDVPQRRTPKPSPRGLHTYIHPYHSEETARPMENGGDYFPPMPAAASPAVTTISHHSTHSTTTHAASDHARAMSVLNTGQVPPLPSPGGTRRTHHNRSNRPSYIRQHTSSPTTLTASGSAPPQKPPRPRLDSNASDHRHATSVGNAPLPTPPAPSHDPTVPVQPSNLVNPSLPASPLVSSPGPRKAKKSRKSGPAEAAAPSIPTSLGLDTSVPPINVLIVEDNHINLKLLEQFIRRLKVRWATAVNGREAVNKWRAGGFHLVLMDIQLPIMSGLEATKEIRRLERVNGIGVFSGAGSGSASSEAPKLLGRRGTGLVEGAGQVENGAPEEKEEASEEDKLDVERLFKSPVIIVALTASNLQVDRHEALAAGCNDFLTKPVNFVWFERKVKEWGCMQALIDFDGWRKWKDFASSAPDAKANGTKAKVVKKPLPLRQTISTDDVADSTPDEGSGSS